MNKKVLSEIDIYLGTVDMPKYFEINRDELKSSLLSSVVKDKSFKNSIVINNPNDFEMLNGKAFTMFNTYIIENFHLKHDVQLVNQFNFGSIFEEKENSITKNLIDKYRLDNSPDYTCIYGIDVEKNSQQLILEYSDKRLVQQFLKLELKNNEYVIFPSTLNYFFNKNTSNKINTYLTTAYGIMRY